MSDEQRNDEVEAHHHKAGANDEIDVEGHHHKAGANDETSDDEVEGHIYRAG